ncbi:ACT domain-containing protein [bacterium]|nr:ACT domain-containing protein [bacterium]
MPDPVIDLLVQNHAGVMSHVTGLFSRRAFNLEGILCGPVEDGAQSRMFLLVNEDRRLPQLLNELAKLYDVIHVELRHDIPRQAFDPMQVVREEV